MKTVKNLLLVLVGIIILSSVFAADTITPLSESKIKADMYLTKEAKSIIKYTETFNRIKFLSVKQGDTLTSTLYYTAKNAFGVPVERCVSAWVLVNIDGSINTDNKGGDVEHGECKH